MIAVCAADEYVMEHSNADTTFLNSGLVGIVYMDIPFVVKNAKSMMWKLQKAIYGLKQAESA